MVIYSGFSHWKWWFSIAMLVYQRVYATDVSFEATVFPKIQVGTGAFLLFTGPIRRLRSFSADSYGAHFFGAQWWFQRVLRFVLFSGVGYPLVN